MQTKIPQVGTSPFRKSYSGQTYTKDLLGYFTKAAKPKTNSHSVGDVWKGPSGRWFTRRQDGRTVPAKAPGGDVGPSKPKRPKDKVTADQALSKLQEIKKNGLTKQEIDTFVTDAVNKMTVTELSKLRRQIGAKTASRKADIISKIKESLSNQQNTVENSKPKVKPEPVKPPEPAKPAETAKPQLTPEQIQAKKKKLAADTEQMYEIMGERLSVDSWVERNQVLIPNAESILKNMTSQQKDAVRSYTSYDSHAINNALKKGDTSDPKIDKLVKQIDSIFENAPKFDRRVKTFRVAKMKADALNSFLEKAEGSINGGDPVQFKEYLSTSIRENLIDHVADMDRAFTEQMEFEEDRIPVKFVITARKGLYVEDNLTEAKGEDEILLPRDQKFKISRVSDDTTASGKPYKIVEMSQLL